MNSIFGIAQSGLHVASLRLATSAHNVSNALTEGFVPGRVEAEEVPGGGVTGRAVSGNDPLFDAQMDRVTVALSQTDLAQEMVAQSLAATSFRASLATLRTADEMVESLVDLES